MDRSNRPYKGMQAEFAERQRLYEPEPELARRETNKDSVIEAAKACLLIGSCTFFLIIGFPFFTAAFFLGIYAMATHRIKEGVIISLSALVLTIIATILFHLIWFVALLGLIFGKNPPPMPVFK